MAEESNAETQRRGDAEGRRKKGDDKGPRAQGSRGAQHSAGAQDSDPTNRYPHSSTTRRAHHDRRHVVHVTIFFFGVIFSALAEASRRGDPGTMGSPSASLRLCVSISFPGGQWKRRKKKKMETQRRRDAEEDKAGRTQDSNGAQDSDPAPKTLGLPAPTGQGPCRLQSAVLARRHRDGGRDARRYQRNHGLTRLVRAVQPERRTPILHPDHSASPRPPASGRAVCNPPFWLDDTGTAVETPAATKETTVQRRPVGALFFGGGGRLARPGRPAHHVRRAMKVRQPPWRTVMCSRPPPSPRPGHGGRDGRYHDEDRT